MTGHYYGNRVYQCQALGCGWRGIEYLVAPNPFDTLDDISGCPDCKAVEQIVSGCQWIGCTKPSTRGYPIERADAHNAGYVVTCYEHAPPALDSKTAPEGRFMP